MIDPSQYLYVGVDVHKDNHAACITDCFLRTLAEKEIKNEKEDFAVLSSLVCQISKERRIKPVFGLEDGYGNGLFLATYLAKQGYQIKVVNPVLVDRERRRTTHREKSDLLDAKGVAKVLIHEGIDRLPDYSIAGSYKTAKELREIANDREFLIKEQTRLKNQLHRLLHRSYGSSYRQYFKTEIGSKKVLEFFMAHPHPKNGPLVLEEEITANQIRRKTKRLLAILKEVKEVEEEIKALLDKSKQKLSSMNGCGPVVTALILAEVKDIKRFKSPSAFAKYAGLCPKEKSSGKRRRHLVSNSGNRRLNKAFYRIALTQIGNHGNQYAKAYFAKKIKEGKTKTRALICLKRRLADIVYIMLKTNKPYQYHAEILRT